MVRCKENFQQKLSSACEYTKHKILPQNTHYEDDMLQWKERIKGKIKGHE